MLDLEIMSIASKEYDPANMPSRGQRFRSSHNAPTTSTKMSFADRINEEKRGKPVSVLGSYREMKGGKAN